MGALSEIYVDPSIAGDSGTGTVGDPYGDLEYAIEQTTFDTTNGTRVNIKAGTDEVLAADISAAMADTVTTAAWAPGAGKPALFQGYTTAAGDGGIGGISGGGSVSVFSGANGYVQFRDLHCHNCGSAAVLSVTGSFGVMVINVEVDNTTGDGIQFVGATIRGCNVHNIGGIGCHQTNDGPGYVADSYFKNGTNDFTAAIELYRESSAFNNIISVDGTSDGIITTSYFKRIEGNSVYTSSGNGEGIRIDSANGVFGDVLSNMVEGFNINFDINVDLLLYGHNASYNGTTHYSVSGDTPIDLGDNEELSASPFDKSGSDTFANRFVYFAPVDTGNVHGGAYTG